MKETIPPSISLVEGGIVPFLKNKCVGSFQWIKLKRTYMCCYQNKWYKGLNIIYHKEQLKNSNIWKKVRFVQNLQWNCEIFPVCQMQDLHINYFKLFP